MVASVIDIFAYTEKEKCVYDAMARLIDSGVDVKQLTTTDIAKEAKVGKGTLYLYFKNKEDIIIRAGLYIVCNELKNLSDSIDKREGFHDKCDAVFDMIQKLSGDDCLFFNMALTLHTFANNNELMAIVEEYKERILVFTREIMHRAIKIGKERGEINEQTDDSYLMQVMLGEFAVVHLLIQDGNCSEGIRENAHKLLAVAIK